MKFVWFFVILSLTIFCNCDDMITTWTEPKVSGLDGNTIKVYSMVWSAKYYNPSEIKTFFFAVPFAFNTNMKVETLSKNIHLEFPNYSNAMDMFRTLKEEGQKAEQCTFNKVITFSDNYTKVDLSLDFPKNTDYALSLVHAYENKFAKSVQIKITQPNSKLQRALYVTFDFAKGEAKAEDIQSFLDFLNGIKTSI